MGDAFADGDDGSALRLDETCVCDSACVASRVADPDIKTAEAGVGFGVGCNADLETGGEDRLA